MKKLIALLVALCLSVGLCACSENEKNEPHKDESQNADATAFQGTAIKGYTSTDGNVYIPTPSGEIVTVQKWLSDYTAQAAWLTPDEKHIVSIQSNHLVCSDFSQTKSIDLGLSDHVFTVQNEGVLYIGENEHLCLYSFDQEKEISHNGMTPPAGRVIVAERTLSCGFADDDTVYVWPHDETDPIEIGYYPEARVHWISNDGETLIWTGEGDALFMYQDKTVVTLTTRAESPYGLETTDGKLCIINDTSKNGCLYIQRPGKEMHCIDIETYSGWTNFYTSAGPLNQSTANEADTIYALSDSALYAIDKNNKTHIISEGITQFSIYGNRLVYQEGDRLFFATLEDNEIKNPVQAAIDVVSYQTNDNQTIYYVKRVNRNGHLYEIDFDNKQPQFINNLESIVDLDYVYELNPYTGWLFCIEDQEWDDTLTKTLSKIRGYNGPEQSIHLENIYDYTVAANLPWHSYMKFN